jgi:hypothetical protein
LQCIFIWGQPAPEGDIQQAQIIVTQASSNCYGNRPSKTNFALAGFAEMYHRRLGIPLFPQEAVARILMANNVEIIATTKSYDLPLLSAEYGSGSRDVAELQNNFCRERGWTKVLLVAFSPHAWRARWIYERLGLEVIIPENLPKIQFQSDLSEWRWRRAVTAYPYEFFTRLWFMYKGYI